MLDPNIPTIQVTITPQFTAESLNITLCIESLSIPAGSTIVSFPSNLHRSTSIRPLDGVWQAYDYQGTLPILCTDENGTITEEWRAARNTSGRVAITYSAYPSTDAKLVGPGSATDLSSDHGGLLGSGFSFIPIPPGNKIYRCTVAWRLQRAPEGTSAVWTFGEGPNLVEKTGPASILSDSVYMVGPIHSNPPDASVQGTISDYYGYYCFGTLPANIEVIKDIHHAFFVKVSDFFNDSPSATNPYRSFVWNTNPLNRAFGGTAFTRSHIFSYDDRISEAKDYDLIRRMAYEMVHNFLGPSVTDSNIDWLFEGVKNALSVYLPFRPPAQFRTGHYFQATITMLCTKYYTSPLLQRPYEEVLKLADEGDAYAKEHLSARAWAFVIGTDLASRKLLPYTKGSRIVPRPLEDLPIKVLANKRRDGKANGLEDWIELLTPVMGIDARERYEYMWKGEVILLPVEVFGARSHYLKQVDEEVLDFGMDREGLDDGVVMRLKEGSRAEKAGLKEGDRVVWSSYCWRFADDFDAEMEIVVQREGQDVRMKYWPRAFEKAKSWNMVEAEKT